MLINFQSFKFIILILLVFNCSDQSRNQEDIRSNNDAIENAKLDKKSIVETNNIKKIAESKSLEENSIINIHRKLQIDSLFQNSQICDNYLAVDSLYIISNECESNVIEKKYYKDHTEKFKCVVCKIPCQYESYYIAQYYSDEGGHRSDRLYLVKYSNNLINKIKLLGEVYQSENYSKTTSFSLEDGVINVTNHIRERNNGVDEFNENIDVIDVSCQELNIQEDLLFSDCNIYLQEYIVNKFKETALNVYYDNIFIDSIQPEFMNSNINSFKVDAVLKIFQLINNSYTLESDTIIRLLDFRHYSEKSLHEIQIYGDTNNYALDNLKNGIIPTGDAVLDKIMLKYNLKLKSATYYPKYGRIAIHSKSKVNTYPISLELLKSGSVNRVSIHNNWIYNKSDIKLVNDGDGKKIIFRYGSGDCVAGCINNRYWEFKIEECTVEFYKSYGDQIEF